MPKKRRHGAIERGDKLVMVINMARRSDRLRRLRHVLRGTLDWERVDAVDGHALTWKEVAEYVSVEALEEARWAEQKRLPTICVRTGSFSPHLTLSAVGCALSHRKAWQRLAASKEHDCASLDLDPSDGPGSGSAQFLSHLLPPRATRVARRPCSQGR